MRKTLIAFALALSFTGIGGGTAIAAGPTCSNVLDIATHGQHVVGDYVTGIGHGDLSWPPKGVGAATGGSGAVLPGGPGPGFHFPKGFAPGASFCVAESRSPGFHVPD